MKFPGLLTCNSLASSSSSNDFEIGSKQCSHATCREHKAYLGLRPARISEISGDVGAETCQHRSEEKIDAVETLKARIESRDICSTK